MSRRFEDFIGRYQELKALGRDFVVVTLSKVVGSAPQDLGARMIVTKTGLDWGTVGGGKVENFIINKSIGLLTAEIDPSKVSYLQCEVNLQTDLGMSCGGAVGFLLEVVRSDLTWSVVVFGAGHVSQELIPLLCKLEAQVTCVETRSEWLAKLADAKNLKKILVPEMSSLIAELSEASFIVSITMGHSTDVPILAQALRRKFPFVGVIGSELKAQKIKNELVIQGLSQEQVSRLNCPLGLKLGTNAPFEIAISILAQLIQRRDLAVLESTQASS